MRINTVAYNNAYNDLVDRSVEKDIPLELYICTYPKIAKQRAFAYRGFGQHCWRYMLDQLGLVEKTVVAKFKAEKNNDEIFLD